MPLHCGKLAAVLLNRTRYDKVVEALGGHGEYVTRPEELRQDREYSGGIYV